MALPVLDGNQSATTLSSIVTGGEHIVAHSVVSLGANAISDITSAVSGSVVSVSNFPASQSTTFGAVTGSVSVLNFPSTQTIAGTVTANLNTIQDGAFGAYDSGSGTAINQNLAVVRGTDAALWLQDGGGNVPVSGTVTANVGKVGYDGGNETNYFPIAFVDSPGGTLIQVSQDSNGGLPISGTVTVSSLPASTVTVSALPSGALSTRFGSVVTANLSQITSAVTNTSRKYLLAQNISAGTVTIGIGFSPTTTQGIQLTAGAGLTFDAFCPTGAVYWLGAVTGANYCLIEG